MIECSNSIDIQRPLSTVAFYAANPDRAISWYQNIKKVTWLTPRPLQKGSRLLFEARFMGRSMRYTYEVIEYEPKKMLVMEASDGPFPMKTTYRWEQVGPDRTRMTLINAGGNFKWFRKWAIRSMNKANQKDLLQLKRILEAHQRS